MGLCCAFGYNTLSKVALQDSASCGKKSDRLSSRHAKRRSQMVKIGRYLMANLTWEPAQNDSRPKTSLVLGLFSIARWWMFPRFLVLTPCQYVLNNSWGSRWNTTDMTRIGGQVVDTTRNANWPLQTILFDSIKGRRARNGWEMGTNSVVGGTLKNQKRTRGLWNQSCIERRTNTWVCRGLLPGHDNSFPLHQPTC